MTTSPRTGRFSAQRRFEYGRPATLFDSYVSPGRVSLAIGSHGGRVSVPQCADRVALWEAGSREMERRSLATVTGNAYGRAAGEIFLFSEASESTSLEAAGGSTVFGYLESLRAGGPSALWTVVSSSPPFLMFFERQVLLDALKIACARRWHQLVPAKTKHSGRSAPGSRTATMGAASTRLKSARLSSRCNTQVRTQSSLEPHNPVSTNRGQGQVRAQRCLWMTRHQMTLAGPLLRLPRQRLGWP